MAKKNKSVNLLPEFLRTKKNSKFLSSTLDQFVQAPELERIDGFIGSKLTLTYNSKTDSYINESLPLRKNYQLEPALIINDINKEQDVIGLDDLINELKINGSNTDNLDRLFRSEYYSFDPNIDWDKFVNFQEYYWLTTGPDAIEILGTPRNSTSTFTVIDNPLTTSFIFTPDGLTEDPLITLYRGNTYNFEINSTYNFYIKTLPTIEQTSFFNVGVTNNGTSTGVISIVVNELTPDTLFYVSNNQEFAQGKIIVKNLDQDSVLDVEAEIIGKKYYTSFYGIKFTNGMKIKFSGEVYPEKYKNKEFYIEGVGTSIKLIDFSSLYTSEEISSTFNENFDATPFDSFPFDKFKNLPIDPEYFTINRASVDLNPWSRYNRWFHSDVIKLSAEANNKQPIYPLDKRARRPIIEFNSGIQLYNFGTVALEKIDLIDNITIDVFNFVEGSYSYYVDGVLLEEGQRVIFNADQDLEVRGKIYIVKFVKVNGRNVINLEKTNDHNPFYKASISIVSGNEYAGTSWWYNGETWIYSQQHTQLNQPPLFDLFDENGNSYSENYESNFTGTKIFSYEIGTGSNDEVLGIPLKYENSIGSGSYLFKNDFMTDDIVILVSNQNNLTVPTATTFLKYTNTNKTEYLNVWKKSKRFNIPIIQIYSVNEPTNKIQITVLNKVDITDLKLDVFINTLAGKKKLPNDKFEIVTEDNLYYVMFDKTLQSNANVIFKIYTKQTPNKNGFYESPLSLTNNPKNNPISFLTFSEISDHLNTMIDNYSEFKGNFPGKSNLRDIGDISSYGNRLISSLTPIAFSNFFIAKKENSLIDAITKVADQYNFFKLSFFKKISESEDQLDPVEILEKSLADINRTKTIKSAYYYSDMIPYGTDKTVRFWNIKNSENKIFPIANNFDPTKISNKACLVYLNREQLLLGKDYTFNVGDSSIEITVNLKFNDILEIVEYSNTHGSFVPVTPTKLGLYPAFEPKIFTDNSYADGPVIMIQGHDGSLTKAYNDYRDNVILEFEKRIFNNLKTNYRREILDINKFIPGAFRETEYSLAEVNDILQKDFVKWAGFYGIDYISNSTFKSENVYTWNFKDSYISNIDLITHGTWRSIYYYLYDTDKPHISPWEMLGFTIKPEWWEQEYGPAPYTSGNDILWEDIAKGVIRQGDRQGVDITYIRKNLKDVLPVDDGGNLISPEILISNITEYNKRQNWKFGDFSPVEVAWRRSSYYPFAIQKLLALIHPSVYASLMYDPASMKKNLAGQWIYKDRFLNFDNLNIHTLNENINSGYSSFVVETGYQKNLNYIDNLQYQIKNNNFNLFYKVGGFVSKNKIQIIIDSFDPLSTSPGALLPPEDYNLILNVSNPIKSSNISGIIVQKIDGKFVIKGYDRLNPYFTVLTPIRTAISPTITIGGVSAPYVVWESSASTVNTGLSVIDTTSASSISAGKFYQAGQIVLYNNKFYRVKTSHLGESTFNENYFQQIPSLPIKGGATVQLAKTFAAEPQKISYGTEFNTIQEVYDLIIGYGKWLESEGFIFDEFNNDLNSVIDWNFSGKEFLYWTTQNWADNSIITLSPFAEKIKFKFINSAVDNVFNKFYEYNILRSNGTPIPEKNISVNREDGLFTLELLNFSDGIYFATLNSVQKEHAMVFNNKTIFNDTIYDIETGYRQLRMKISGFRTKNWDGDYFSPGFLYDEANISNWKEYTDYQFGSIVKFNGKYYSANTNVSGTSKFNFENWNLLLEKPVADLIPNFDYKINQFEDFYSLDIDNFDDSQQKMAQHLIGYTPRVYLNNIFTNPIAQYKFYQGFIKEKGTRNAFDKLAKATIHNLQGKISFTEEWAFRIGHYGSFETFKEIEVPLDEQQFIENPQVVSFSTAPVDNNEIIYNITESDIVIKPDNFNTSNIFVSKKYSEDDFQIKTAGYVRLDDITYTAFNDSDLLTILNNSSINQNDVVWVGFKNNDDWDVYRYILAAKNIIDVKVKISGSELIFTTRDYHLLKEGDIISVIQVDDQVNGVYKIKSIPTLNQFIVSTDIEEIADIEFNFPGLIFKFESLRFENYSNFLPANKMILAPYGTKFWLDNDADNSWRVYEKTKNLKPQFIIPEGNLDQHFGKTILSYGNIKLISAPNYRYSNGNFGKVNVYVDQYIFNFTLNDTGLYVPYNTATNIGTCLEYDPDNFNNTGYGLIFAGAPSASFVKSADVIGDIRYAIGTGEQSIRIEEGALKIISIDPSLIVENPEIVLLSPDPADYEHFGACMYLQKASTVTNKLLLVNACGSGRSDGRVYSFVINSSENSLVVDVGPTGIEILPGSNLTLQDGDQWGYSISGNEDGSVIAISAPGYSNKGVVQIFDKTTYKLTINPPDNFINGRFGEKVLVNKSGNYLLVTTPNYTTLEQTIGRVTIYHIKKQNNLYEAILITNLYNPVLTDLTKFGFSIDCDDEANTVVISSLGNDNYISTTFDKFSEQYLEEEKLNLVNYSNVNTGTVNYANNPWSSNNIETIFDKGSTRFFDSAVNSGIVYVYDKKENQDNINYILSHEVRQQYLMSNTNFGYSISLDQNKIYIGSPSISALSTNSTYHEVIKLDNTINGLKILRKQENLVDVSTIRKISLIDSFKEEIVDYLEVIDPVKGKISGLADQEIKYKSFYDPAIYSQGTDEAVVDDTLSWGEEHLGEVWWDLKSVKYIWYEQGDLLYRKNNWNKLFPGSTIDIYEWVKSDYQPDAYLTLADTPSGLIDGISGVPKYNNIFSIKRLYDRVSNSFKNVYYYWVKNKVTIPNVQNRRISTAQISKIIADPTAYGILFASVLSKNSMSLSNVGNFLIGDRINLNVSFDTINNRIPKHTEWLLLQENSTDSVPNILLEKKLIDSLLGYDSLGNKIPDPNLPERSRYGISIRPRQGMFKNRIEALRNLFEFVNSVLEKNQISGNYSFKNLEKQEEVPPLSSNEYDQLVEDNNSLELIDTRLLTKDNKPSLKCVVNNGKIKNVIIENPGIGYKTPPTIRIDGNGVGAELTTEIDSLGKIIKVNIINSGEKYTFEPILKVRDFTVIVLADSLYNNKWTKFSYDVELQKWVRLNTQKYNTTLYWKYIDWKDESFDQFKDFTYTVDDVYELEKLVDIDEKDYIKVKNSGNGTYIILEKISDNIVGTFQKGFNLVYSQNGTIQLLDTLWTNEIYNFDYENNFDQTLYNQTPDIELSYILSAIKSDLFVDNLKINWNLFFFKAVKYALTEQKLLDWAFKTSFINVINEAGLLDTRPVYKLQNSSYFEDYINEVKPYHTKVRNFVTKYNSIDNSNSYITDFDLPAKYNKETNVYESISLGNENLTKLPWKAWADNYTFSVASILIGNPGYGYFIEPVVEIITAPGDTGSGAKAKAYIRSGTIFSIEVTNPGSGYIKPPMIVIKDNGNSEVIPATAYAQLSNEKIRVNKIGLKFDRITDKNEIGEKITTDRFVCNGARSEFVLNWLAEKNKSKIDITLDGTIVLSDDYTIVYYKEIYNGYYKKYSKIVFLNYVPNINQILEVTYPKSIELFNATERILTDYRPTSEMPGIDLPQLMYGIEYPQNIIEGLTFPLSSEWDVNYSSFDNFKWGSNTTNYNEKIIAISTPSNSSNLTLNNVTNLNVGDFVNLISTTTNSFNTSTVTIESIDEGSNTITLSSPTNRLISLGEQIEFWSTENNEEELDHSIQGGSWDGTLGTFVGALGINPEDIIIDGDKFLNPNSRSGPEELVPGNVVESIAINVFTKNSFGAPMVFSGYFGVSPGAGATYKLPIAPPNLNSISVTLNDKILTYVSDNSFSQQDQYSIDWQTNELVIPQQTFGGTVGFIIVSIGGGRVNSGAGVIDSSFMSIENASTQESIQVTSLASYQSVKSVYVTLNGSPVSPYTTSTEVGYVLTFANNDNNRAAVNVYGIPLGKNTIQAWFFSTPYKYFNEITEQTFLTTATLQSNFNLQYPPGNATPGVAHILVELFDGTTRRQLLPPSINYYEVTNSLNYTFLIDKNISRPPNTFNLTNVNAYLNGVLLRPGFDYSISSPNNTITFVNNLLKTKDILTIIGLVSGDYDFNLINNTLVLSTPISNSQLKVITYTDHDGMLMRTERFQGNPSRRYKISRPALNDNYIWVSVNGIPLTSKLDYEVLDDQVTIQVSDLHEHSITDDIVIVSVGSENLASTVLGYKIFNDIFNKTHFKRISKENTTYLIEPLNFDDTEIVVANPEKLTPPSISRKIPGVVWIDGERVEFWKIEDNKLTELRRATLGTAPSFYCDINTKVVDQGYEQTIPFNENIYRQIQYTNTSTNTYYISTVTTTATGAGITLSLPQSIVFTTSKIDTSLASLYAETALNMINGSETVDLAYDLNGDNAVTMDDYNGYLRLSNRLSLGFVPATSSNFLDLLIKETISTNTINAIDQVAVYYGGRLLKKSGSFQQDTTVSYDSLSFNIKGNIGSVAELPQTTILGNAYILTTTNQVWIYTESIEVNSVNGYVYTGINYVEPEFTINTSTQAITLNIKNGIQNNVKLTIMKKEFPRNNVWNDEINDNSTISLIESTSTQAQFLKFKPAELPDNYYYGGDPTLINDNGFALTDNSDEPLEGF